MHDSSSAGLYGFRRVVVVCSVFPRYSNLHDRTRGRGTVCAQCVCACIFFGWLIPTRRPTPTAARCHIWIDGSQCGERLFYDLERSLSFLSPASAAYGQAIGKHQSLMNRLAAAGCIVVDWVGHRNDECG